MALRVYAVVALMVGALLLSGCGSRAAPDPAPAPQGAKGDLLASNAKSNAKPAGDGIQPVTLHVEGMSRRLGLF